MSVISPIGLSEKDQVRACATTNVTVSGPGATIDGVAPTSGDQVLGRVLLTGQTAPAENGIYVWNGAAAAMTRAYDAQISAMMPSGHRVQVGPGGTNNANTEWICTTAPPITLGTTGLTYKRLDGAWDEWETLYDGSGQLPASSVAGTYLFRQDGGTMSTALLLSGAQKLFPLDPANYAVVGKTIQCRVVGHVQTGGTAPAITFTFGLYPVSSVSALTATLGAVSGNTAAVASPAINTQTAAWGTGFSMPAAGTYLLAVALSGTMGAAAVNARAALQIRAV